MLHVRREIKETVHLQNLNCLASLRTKVIPGPVSSEAIQRIGQTHPSRDRQAASRSNLAYVSASCISPLYNGAPTGFDPHLCVSVDLLSYIDNQGKYWKVRASIFQDPVRKIIRPPLASSRLVHKTCGQIQHRRSFEPAFLHLQIFVLRLAMQ